MANFNFPGSVLLSRMMLALRAGLQFGGARDLYNVYGYNRILTPEMLYDKYARQDIAASVVDKPASAIWTDPPVIKVNDKPLGPEWDSFVSDFGLWSVLLRADKLLGMEQYVVLLLGLPGDPMQPAPKGVKPAFIQAYGASRAQVTNYIMDPYDPEFGRPLTYNLQVGNGVEYVKSMAVHSSRVVHLTNELLENSLLSDARLAKGFNILEDILKVAGGSAETFWLTANRGTQVDVDKEMELSTDDAAALSAEIEEYQHQLRRVIRTRGVKINTLGSDVADPTGVFRVSLSLLASTYGIPQRILIGAEAGQLASAQDRANWAVTIEERRKSFAQPYVLLPVLKKLQALEVIPKISGEITYEWPEAFKVSPLERAQTMAQVARAVVNMSRQTQLGNPIITTQECREVIGFPAEPEGETLPSVQDAMDWQNAQNEQKAAAAAQNNPNDGQNGQNTPTDGQNKSTTQN